jgi:hypothetical protein
MKALHKDKGYIVIGELMAYIQDIYVAEGLIWFSFAIDNVSVRLDANSEVAIYGPDRQKVLWAPKAPADMFAQTRDGSFSGAINIRVIPGSTGRESRGDERVEVIP